MSGEYDSLIIVGLVLLTLGLIYYKTAKSNSASASEGMSGNHNISTYGSGVKSRTLAKQYNDLVDNAAGYDDYADAVKYMSLDPTVFASQASYANEVGIVGNTAAAMSVRSDSNSPTRWVGLRRPDVGSVPISSDARQVPSEYSDQLERPQYKYGLF